MMSVRRVGRPPVFPFLSLPPPLLEVLPDRLSHPAEFLRQGA
jgi:hypothetical protein